MKKKLTNSELVYICRQISMLLKAGISLLEAISILQDDAVSEDGRTVLSTIYNELLETGEIKSALQKTEVFPAYLIHMVEIGELSGNLDDTFASLAIHYQREADLSKSIRGALTYPLIMLGMLSAVLLVLIVKVMPIFSQVFQDLGAEMGGMARSLLALGDSLRRYSLVFLLLLLVLAALTVYLSRTQKGKAQLRTLTQKLPLTRIFSEKIACSRFASGLSIALHSGLDTESAFDLVIQLVDHPDFNQKINQARDLIHNGQDFSDALNQAGIFSGMDARMVSVGFRAGSADSVLSDISVRLQNETDEKLQNIAGLLEPTLVAVLSILVGLILLSVMLPLVGIMSNIG